MSVKSRRFRNAGIATFLAVAGWQMLNGTMTALNHNSIRGEKVITELSELEKTANSHRDNINRYDQRKIKIGFNKFPEPEISGKAFSTVKDGVYYIFIPESMAYPSIVEHELYHVLSGDCDRAQNVMEFALPVAYKLYFEPKAILYTYTNKKF